MPRSGPDPGGQGGPTPAALGLAGSGRPEDGGSLRAGLRVSRAVSASPGPAEAYKTVLPVLQSELPASVARLWLREIGGEQMVCVDWLWSEPRFQPAAESPFGITCRPGEGLAGTCWITGQVMRLGLSDRPDLFPNRDTLQQVGIGTVVAIPLTGVVETVGVLTLYFAGDQLPPGDLEQLALLGAAVGAVIEAKQRDAAAREQLRRDQLLLSATSAVAAAGGYQETLRMLAASAVPGLADLCLIDLVSADGRLERAAAVHADPEQAPLVEELKAYYAPEIGSTHPAGQVTATGESIWSASMPDEFLQQTTQDEHHYEIVHALGFTSYLTVPLRAGEKVLGAITLISAGSGRVFTEQDLATGERLADQVAGTIARARDRELEQQRSAEVSARQQALLELGSELNGAQAVDDVLRALLGSPICSLGAPLARIGLLDESRGLLQLTFAGEVPPELASRFHVVGMDSPVPMVEVVKRGRPLLAGDTTRLPRRYQPLISDTAQFVRGMALEPLRAEDGTVLGAVGLSWPEPHALGSDEVEMLDAVAAALSRAVARILVAQREHEVAASLQERLLALDTGSPSAVVSAVYRPSGRGMQVGGDWYTARVLDAEQRIGVSVGDVVGHGLDAVATMSQLRSALEASALAESDPAHVLALLDRYAQGVPGAACATAAYARVAAACGRVHYCCAGHPYPLLVAPDGQVRFLTDGRSAPLGIEPEDTPGPAGQADLPAGSLFILYSDGLIERHGESLNAGLDRLRVAAADCHQLAAQAVCDRLLVALADETGYLDDVVVVALRPVGTTAQCHVDCVPADLGQIPFARHRLRTWMNQLGLGQAQGYDLLLAVGESVNNAIEHASARDPRRFVAIEAFADEHRVEVSVTDTGRWSKDTAVSRRTDERGRGLTLIHGLSDRVDTVRGPLGTRVTMTFIRRPAEAETPAQPSGVSSS
ncbi:MAG TPA: SpoIIE family protein phosphatase [Solirubrobacteraceae bacterium]|nr:SpoIIE family protein phosphatase [Solirubrobacteraceae bacterium]